jgi:hypothetical protein
MRPFISALASPLEASVSARTAIVSLLALAGLVTGCATVRNTPAQELGWDRWKTCDHFSMIALDRIDLDGRLVVNGHAHEARPFTACVHEAAADQVRRGASPAPAALVLVKIYGCQGGAN